MNTLFLIAACVVSTFSPQSASTIGPAVQDTLPSLRQSMNQIVEWETKQQMRESGVVIMTDYERYLADPSMTLLKIF